MTYDFDTVIDRRNTTSLKWDRYSNSNILPFWVADMDFQSAPEIIDSLRQRIDHGVFGYTVAGDELETLVVERMKERYDWSVKSEWLVWLPGLVPALNLAVRTVTAKGETVAVPKPIYYPFLMAPELAERNTIHLSWVARDGSWQLDLTAFEQQLTNDTKLLMLCNPQNPNGRVLEREELEQISTLCQRYNLVICSDEVHCDLILDRQKKHTPIASLDEWSLNHSITLMSPSKTFNLAGFGCAFAIIPDDNLRERFQQVRKGIVPDPDNMLIGYTAAKAAYTYGEPWRQQLLEYLRNNYRLLAEAVDTTPGLSMLPLESTYLCWIDVSQLKLADPQAFFESKGVGLSPGDQFGDHSFVRFNFGCSRSVLNEGINRVTEAVQNL